MLAPRMQGLSLIEVLTVLSIIALAATLALPSFQHTDSKYNVVTTSGALSDFIGDARSQAVMRNEPVTIALQKVSEERWCVGAAPGTDPCNCLVRDRSDERHCAIGDVRRVFDADSGALAMLTEVGSDTTVTFDPRNGMKSQQDIAGQHHVQLMSRGGQFGLQVSIRPGGNVTVCNYDDELKIGGFPNCEPELQLAAVDL